MGGGVEIFLRELSRSSEELRRRRRVSRSVYYLTSVCVFVKRTNQRILRISGPLFSSDVNDKCGAELDLMFMHNVFIRRKTNLLFPHPSSYSFLIPSSPSNASTRGMYPHKHDSPPTQTYNSPAHQ